MYIYFVSIIHLGLFLKINLCQMLLYNFACIFYYFFCKIKITVLINNYLTHQLLFDNLIKFQTALKSNKKMTTQ